MIFDFFYPPLSLSFDQSTVITNEPIVLPDLLPTKKNPFFDTPPPKKLGI
jgi:hypothetical protein